MKLKILGGIVLLLVVIQFVPYGRDHSNPPVVAEPAWDSPKTRETFFVVCGDCHSNETKWPVYSNVAPISWLVQSDVDEGREHFNVSMWGVQKTNHGEEAAEAYMEGEMPPWIYQLPRPQTRLSNTERNAFIKGLTATFLAEKGYGESENENEKEKDHDDDHDD